MKSAKGFLPRRADMKKFLALAGTAIAAGIALLAAVPAAAQQVQWGVQISSPGYQVYQPPVYVQPQPVYVQPRPVYVQPRPVVVQPQPVYVQPSPVYIGHNYPGPHWQHHHRGYGYRDQDHDGIPNRYDRDRDGDGVPNAIDRRPNNPYRY
jgi:hypothetical protein